MTEQENEQKIKSIVDKITEEYKPEKIFLFGSFAWGNPTKDSDIDLFVVKKSDKSTLEMMKDVYNIIFEKGEAVDVLVYTPEQLEKRKKIGDPFILKIINNGKLLYGTK
ncbi:MAG: nucleotidyltransferase domain-containing protein [Patescibacteria group bacterium]